nr:transcription factor HHO5-like [Ipomoea batatas]
MFEAEGKGKVEEFLPLKGNSGRDSGEKRSNDQGEKNNWMSSATLWNHPVTYGNSNSSVYSSRFIARASLHQ